MMINIIIILENEAVPSLVMRDKVPNQYADEVLKLAVCCHSLPSHFERRDGSGRCQPRICDTAALLIMALPVSSA